MGEVGEEVEGVGEEVGAAVAEGQEAGPLQAPGAGVQSQVTW